MYWIFFGLDLYLSPICSIVATTSIDESGTIYSTEAEKGNNPEFSNEFI